MADLTDKKKLAGIILLTLFIGFAAGLTVNRYIVEDGEISPHEFRLIENQPVEGSMPYTFMKIKESTGEVYYARKNKQKDGALYWEKIIHPELQKN